MQTNTLKKHSAICTGPAPLEAMFGSQAALTAQILAENNLSFDQSNEQRITLPFTTTGEDKWQRMLYSFTATVNPNSIL